MHAIANLDWRKIPQALLNKGYLFYACVSLLVGSAESRVLSQTSDSELAHDRGALRVLVNSNQDGPVQPDDALTLREAIQIVNGTLPLEQLSEAEKAQVSVMSAGALVVGDREERFNHQSRIDFNLPPENTTIYLVDLLPPLSAPVMIDGTTQPGYGAGREVSGFNYQSSVPPIVEISPANGSEIFRGLVVISDNVTIRGLSLYGFTSRHRATASTPPADILIASRRNGHWVADIPEEKLFDSSYSPSPQNVLIEDNWLGVSAERQERIVLPAEPEHNQETDYPRDAILRFIQKYFTSPAAELSRNSAFGVYVFNGTGTIIRRNFIANHDGSGIITAANAKNLLIENNILEGNGFGGMPDAIRLEGEIQNTQVVSNVIRANAGSGIYLFKPKGAIEIRGNTITDNGEKYKKAAIYLIGSDHQVIDNQIRNQTGPGVVVAAYPNSDRNRIQNNQFSNLQGLSIDLVTQLNTDIYAYQVGDGPNPRTNSHQRRRKTGNFGIDAPRFISREFFKSQQDGSITLEGSAEPDSLVEIYRVTEDTHTRGPLNEAIATTKADEKGRFSIVIPNLQPGERVSAIATHPQSGTSEPAINAVIRLLPISSP